VGTSGPVCTSIVSGLRAGQQVVLANLATPIPTSTGGARGFGGGVVRSGGWPNRPELRSEVGRIDV
jgi:hypothetical protein